MYLGNQSASTPKKILCKLDVLSLWFVVLFVNSVKRSRAKTSTRYGRLRKNA